MRLLLPLLLSGCAFVTQADFEARLDQDGDGFPAAQFGGTDCDDADPDVQGPTSFYVDADGDGLGDPSSTAEACEAGPGLVANAYDCDDTDSDITVATVWHRDLDGDGYGDPEAVTEACDTPTGYVADASDCDDDDATVNPETAWFTDGDDDGHGAGAPVQQCEAPTGHVLTADDCDDAEATVHPGALERCNGADDDCDDLVDADDPDVDPAEALWYRDADGDGYGNPSNQITTCTSTGGYVHDDTDCDDAKPAVNPAATEVCNTDDDDCDGAIDDDDPTVADQQVWYADTDADGYGDAADPEVACFSTDGRVLVDGDCDEADPDVNPGAQEVCNGGVDDDCDGLVDSADDSVADPPVWYVDVDGDGFGTDTTTVACEPGSGWALADGDCDDAVATTFPGAADAWYDGVDANCDGADDYDADADGHRSDAHGGDDCDDTVATTYTGAADAWYDGVDSDCGGEDDYDADGDGHDSDAHGGDDCADTVSTTHPGASDAWYDGVDADCDGADDYDADADGHRSDAHGGDDCDDTVAAVNPDAIEAWYDGTDQDCSGGSDYDQDADGSDSDAYSGIDCDDLDPTINPSAAELWYDGTDQDCRGGSDYDQDGDGYDSDAHSGADCDDLVLAVHPGATELWYDGTDQDCSGGSDYDKDGDGYDRVGYVSGTDCDDEDADVFPGMVADVPSDYATIQAAVDAVCDGSTVQIAGGTYVENVGFGTKALEVVGAGVGVTVIDGGAGQVANVGDGVVGFTDLTLTNGVATNGGALYIDRGTVTLTDVEVTDSLANSHGGGIYAGGLATLHLVRVTVSGNTAVQTGGGLFTQANEVTLEDCALEDNVALENGGGWYANSGTLSALRTTFARNTGRHGGGMYVTGAVVTFADVHFDANGDTYSAANGGGLMALYTDFDADDLWFTDNYATHGAALYLNRSGGDFDRVIVERSLGSAGGATGAYFDHTGCDGAAPLAVRDLLLIDQAADGSGSALVSYQGCGNTWERVDVRDNDVGVAVHATLGTGTETWRGLAVAGNTGDGMGFGAISTISSGRIENAVFVGNGNDGLYLFPAKNGQLTVVNAISSSNGGAGVRGDTAFTSTLRHNDSYGNAGLDWETITDPTGIDGNVSVAPDFVSTSAAEALAWDLHLAPGSPLFDAGDTAILDPDGSTSDIGAYGGPTADYAYYDDLDADGLYDGWETMHGLDPSSDDSADDLDGDGVTNGTEFANGTDPSDPASK